jgi:hydrogenase nickel incorporation protein HypA/HybF
MPDSAGTFMHEMSVAQNIIEIIHQHVPENEWAHVGAVRLKIGSVAGIVSDSLSFSFQAITADTPLQNSHLEIEHVPFEVLCNACNKTSSNEIGFSVCEWCGSADTKTLSGTELQVTEIEINGCVEESA